MPMRAPRNNILLCDIDEGLVIIINGYIKCMITVNVTLLKMFFKDSNINCLDRRHSR